MEGVKDSNFVNFSNSIDAIHRKFTTPKKRGVRDSNIGGEAKLENNLRNDMISILTSPLLQRRKLEPVAGLTAAQILSLRTVYAWIKDGSCLDENFETLLEAAVGLLNPDFTARVRAVAEDQGSDSTTRPSMPVRRSTRLAKLPQPSYDENADDLDRLLLGAESGEEEEADGEEADGETERNNEIEPDKRIEVDEEMTLYENGGVEPMDGVESAY